MSKKEIIGYKLKDDIYKSSAERISISGLCDLDKAGYHVRVRTALEEIFSRLGLLDLWFTPVCKKELELETEMWYKAKQHPQLIYRTGDNQNMGFINDKWSDSLLCYSADEFRPATEEELVVAFTKEAEKRGYKVGVETEYGVIMKTCSIDGERFEHEFYFEENHFYYHNICIFDNGDWAEIKDNEEHEIILPKVWEGKVKILYK